MTYIVILAEENKKLLLDLGAVEALLPLIQHEERIIRRNACMALGTMTAHRKTYVLEVLCYCLYCLVLNLYLIWGMGDFFKQI